MSNQTTIELASYADRFEAETVKIRLAAAGIPSEVFGTDAASAFGMGGAPQRQPVRIEVAFDDLESAREILEQDRREATERGPWICDVCSETNEATFDLCWNCNGPVESPPLEQPDETVPVEYDPVTIDESSRQATPTSENPYRPVLVDDRAHSMPDHHVGTRATDNQIPSPQLRADVKRAFQSAIVGWLIIPPLVSLYSTYRLLKLPKGLPQDRSLRRQVIFAWLINLISIALWSTFWYGVTVG